MIQPFIRLITIQRVTGIPRDLVLKDYMSSSKAVLAFRQVKTSCNRSHNVLNFSLNSEVIVAISLSLKIAISVFLKKQRFLFVETK